MRCLQDSRAALKAMHEEARLFLDGLLGTDGMASLPDPHYTRASKERNGHVVGSLEMVLAYLTYLPADLGAALLTWLEDQYEDAHGDEVEDLFTEMLEASDADCTEDATRARARLPNGDWDHNELRRLVGASLNESRRKRNMRRAAMAILSGRKPPKPSRWRTQDERRAG